ncbi:hypothetical protein C8F01DRAFT_1233306 [Mycena amicta]|nr:hypothetical protein C8F01DRAFT_1233306 [Mycena amicta]
MAILVFDGEGWYSASVARKHREGTEQVQVGEQRGSESENDAWRKAMRGGKRKPKTTEFVEVIRGFTGIEATIWHSSAPIIPGYAHAGHAGKALPNDPIRAQTATLMTSREWIGGYVNGTPADSAAWEHAAAGTRQLCHCTDWRGFPCTEGEGDRASG